eukprot:5270401-Pyramimonas_sp.AAC.1
MPPRSLRTSQSASQSVSQLGSQSVKNHLHATPVRSIHHQAVPSEAHVGLNTLVRTNQTQEVWVYSHDRPIIHRKSYGRAQHGHCRIDHLDLVEPSRHSRVQFSRQFITDTLCPCGAVVG